MAYPRLPPEVTRRRAARFPVWCRLSPFLYVLYLVLMSISQKGDGSGVGSHDMWGRTGRPPASGKVNIDTFDRAAKFIQRLADENSELASILNDPVKMITWLNSSEGQATLEKLTDEMGDLLSDSSVIRELISSLETDPLFEDVEKELPEFAAEVKSLLAHEEL